MDRPANGEDAVPPPPDPRAELADDEGPGGPFPSWRALYVTLIAYTGVLVLVLLFLTWFLNAG